MLLLLLSWNLLIFTCTHAYKFMYFTMHGPLAVLHHGMKWKIKVEWMKAVVAMQQPLSSLLLPWTVPKRIIYNLQAPFYQNYDDCHPLRPIPHQQNKTNEHKTSPESKESSSSFFLFLFSSCYLHKCSKPRIYPFTKCTCQTLSHNNSNIISIHSISKQQQW